MYKGIKTLKPGAGRISCMAAGSVKVSCFMGGYTAGWFTTVLISADVYIKQKIHTDSYYYGGITRPAEDFELETWIGEKKMAYSEQDLAIKIDMEKNRLLVLDSKEKTYVETTLPPDLSKLVEQRLGLVSGSSNTREPLPI